METPPENREQGRRRRGVQGVTHGLMGHIFIGVTAGFPSCSTPSGGHPQTGLSAALGVAALGVAALWAATDSKFTMNS